MSELVMLPGAVALCWASGWRMEVAQGGLPPVSLLERQPLAGAGCRWVRLPRRHAETAAAKCFGIDLSKPLNSEA